MDSNNISENKKEEVKNEDVNKKEEDKKVYGYNKDTEEWHCIECGVSMGKNNPRQLCGKMMCYGS
jgi:hypothetical protein